MAALATGGSSGPTLFFDRSVGTTIPRVLRRLGSPISIEHHQEHFARDIADDVWLPLVGNNGWTVIGYDWSYHKKQDELTAIQQYGIGVFYLWGVQERTWERFLCLARAYERIAQAINSTPRPFIYRVRKSGSLKQEMLA